MTSTVSNENQVDDTTVTLTIDGKEIQAQKGELLISAAQKAGVFIPRFCYHDRLEPVGMCRMCLVEIEGVRGLPPACTTPVAEGMVVRFKEKNVEKAQDGVLEFLLINHPLDCPVCDRGGECPLQDQTLSFGPGESRFIEEKRHWEKPIEISDHVLLDRERCIQCSRCTRFADDIAGDPLITFVERGGHTEVNTFPHDEFASHFSGNIVQICPVGALTAKPYRFNARPWDLESTETTCTKCSIGCKGVAQTSRNEMVRFLGVDSEPINQGWLCDKGRYGFDYIQSENRIRTPFISIDGKKTDSNLNEALDLAKNKIEEALAEYGPESICVIGGTHGTNEDAFSISRLAKGVIGTNKVFSSLRNTLPADLILSSPRAKISDIDSAKAIVVLGADIKETLPVLYLRVKQAVEKNGVNLIEANPYPTSTKSLSSTTIDLVPGDESNSKKEIIDAIQEIAKDGKVVLIAGDINPAQDPSSYIALVSELLKLNDVLLLPSISTSNEMGAIEMGLAPGMLPGRIAQSASSFSDWPNVSRVENDSSISTKSVLQEMEEGKVKVLITFGANPIADFGDIKRASKAITSCETIISVDAFQNETTKLANIFIPATLANEKSGSVTNIEGRVQRVSQVVAPQGNVYDDWKIAALLCERLGVESTFETVDDLTNIIARSATSFAHLTTGVLSRARDGAIIPVDDNKDVLVSSSAPVVDTPSWEPIASRSGNDEDPLTELDREEHHPSANIVFQEMIESEFERPDAHGQHIDQYALRLIFKKQFHSASTLNNESKALSGVIDIRDSHAVWVNPKDIESISLNEDNQVVLKNDVGEATVKVLPNKDVRRGTVLASFSCGHPLRELIDSSQLVTDLRVEAK